MGSAWGAALPAASLWTLAAPPRSAEYMQSYIFNSGLANDFTVAVLDLMRACLIFYHQPRQELNMNFSFPTRDRRRLNLECCQTDHSRRWRVFLSRFSSSFSFFTLIHLVLSSKHTFRFDLQTGARAAYNCLCVREVIMEVSAQV